MKGSYTYDYPRPSLTVDIAVISLASGKLELLLIERRDPPFAGSWALPGGFVDVLDEGSQGEDLIEAAARELEEETGLIAQRDGVYLEQLYTFGTPGRDPRGRVVSVVYFALVNRDLRARVVAGDDASDAEWYDLQTLADGHGPKLAFDHQQIVEMVLERIRGKVDWAPEIAAGLVPPHFTRSELRRVYEVIKGQPQDRSNFAKRFKRMLDDGVFERVEGSTRELPGAGRPPQLYAFVG